MNVENGYVVVVPAFNEAGRVGDTVSEIRRECGDAELVVVDDGSQDGTADEASAHGATVLRHPFNLGYGAALQTGYKYALKKGHRCVVQMDADGQHVPRYIPQLLGPVVSGEADVVIGSRFLKDTGYAMPAVKRAGSAMFSRAVSLVTGKRFTDSTSGFQALSERALRLLATDACPVDFPDADVLIMLHRAGLVLVEVPVEMRPSPKKRTMHSGAASVYYVFKMLLSIFVMLLRKNAEPPTGGGEI